MSYDLMVFRKEAAPTSRSAFMDWYKNQTEWSEPHGYDDPTNTSPKLRDWFMEIIKTFPAMNGPYASDDDEENDFLTDYSVGNDVIYIGFSWSVAEKAYDAVLELAEKHGVGFFDVSSDNGDIFFPVPSGKLEILKGYSESATSSRKEPKPWWKIW
jgi:hypothetical protein